MKYFDRNGKESENNNEDDNGVDNKTKKWIQDNTSTIAKTDFSLKDKISPFDYNVEIESSDKKLFNIELENEKPSGVVINRKIKYKDFSYEVELELNDGEVSLQNRVEFDMFRKHNEVAVKEGSLVGIPTTFAIEVARGKNDLKGGGVEYSSNPLKSIRRYIYKEKEVDGVTIRNEIGKQLDSYKIYAYTVLAIAIVGVVVVGGEATLGALLQLGSGLLGAVTLTYLIKKIKRNCDD